MPDGAFSETPQPQEIPHDKEIRGRIIYSGNLYHGSGEEPELSQPEFRQLQVDFNFGNRRPFGKNDHRRLSELAEGSQTLGYALYTTTDVQSARNYARDRGVGFRREPYLYSIRVHDLPLFDFRTLDGRNNGRIPLELARQWQYYLNHHQDEVIREYGEDSLIIQDYRQQFAAYSNFMENFLNRLQVGREDVTDEERKFHDLGRQPRDLNIHDMLMQRPYDKFWGLSGYAYSRLWSKFVIDELHCNGSIALESGDNTWSGVDFYTAPTVALYKLDSSFVSHTEVEKLNDQ